MISIIVPCYNQANFLEETLTSVLEQTYENWECIIVNDGSPDHTEKIAKAWELKDARFKYVYKENGGLSSARNLGLKNAKGDYILFLDSDDILLKDKLELSIAEVEKNRADIIITDFLRLKGVSGKTKRAYCDLSKVTYDLNAILLDWDSKFTIPIHCAIFSKEIIGDTVFNEVLKAKEDWFFWIEVFMKYPKVSYVNKVLVYYRTHLKSMTKDNSHMQANQMLAFKAIHQIIPTDLQSSFLDKILNDFARRSNNYRSKYLKYKRITKLLTGTLIASVLVLLLILVLK